LCAEHHYPFVEKAESPGCFEAAVGSGILESAGALFVASGAGESGRLSSK